MVSVSPFHFVDFLGGGRSGDNTYRWRKRDFQFYFSRHRRGRRGGPVLTVVVSTTEYVCRHAEEVFLAGLNWAFLVLLICAARGLSYRHSCTWRENLVSVPLPPPLSLLCDGKASTREADIPALAGCQQINRHGACSTVLEIGLSTRTECQSALYVPTRRTTLQRTVCGVSFSSFLSDEREERERRTLRINLLTA